MTEELERLRGRLERAKKAQLKVNAIVDSLESELNDLRCQTEKCRDCGAGVGCATIVSELFKYGYDDDGELVDQHRLWYVCGACDAARAVTADDDLPHGIEQHAQDVVRWDSLHNHLIPEVLNGHFERQRHQKAKAAHEKKLAKARQLLIEAGELEPKS